MTTRTSLAALLAIALLPTGAGAAEITVWEHANFRGASTVFDRAVSALHASGWNDRISSVRVDSGRWEICRDPDFVNCRVLSADMGEIANLESGWNDTLTSLRPVAAASEDSAEQVARRLYRAILGRDPEPDGLRNATVQIERNQTEALVRGMIQSGEYRSLRSQRSAAELLDQIYQGLYGRTADAAARRTYTVPIERGEDAQVVLAILGSGGDMSSAPSGGLGATPTGQGYDLTAQGEGLVVWGNNGRYESLSGAKVGLTRDGKARVDLTGTTPQTFSGTWTAETNDLLRLQIPDIDGRRVDARGIVRLDGGRLARVEIAAGSPGSRTQIVFSFLAAGYRPPTEEMRCIEEARADLEGDRGAPMALLFLAPERARASSGRDELRGEGVILAGAGSFAYRCEVDSRGSVFGASVQRR